MLVVPDWNSMAPPQLAADTPILDVFDPMLECPGPATRSEVYLRAGHRFESFPDARIFQEPLLAQSRFDGHISALAVSDVILIRLLLYQQPQSAQLFHGKFAGLKTIQPSEFLAGKRIHGAVGIQNIDDFEPVPLTNLKIQLVMRRRNLKHTRAEFRIDGLVGHNRYLCAWKWSPAMLADKLAIARIGWVYRNPRVSHQRFGTSRGNLQKRFGIFNDFISHEI